MKKVQKEQIGATIRREELRMNQGKWAVYIVDVRLVEEGDIFLLISCRKFD